MEHWTNKLYDPRHRDKLAIGAFILVLLFVIAYTLVKQNSITTNEQTTIGIITEFHQVNKARFGIVYQYSVKDKMYSAQTGVRPFKCIDGKKGCVGQKFTVYYSSKNPSYSKIDLGDYEKFKTTVEFSH